MGMIAEFKEFIAKGNVVDLAVDNTVNTMPGATLEAVADHAEVTGDTVQGTYEDWKAKGVEFTEEPTERPYGIDCALRDPFGNPVRITQPAQGPVTAEDFAEHGESATDLRA